MLVAAAAVGGPKLTVENKVYDFGELDNAAELEHDFVLNNAGDEPLTVTVARSSCGCLKTELKKLFEALSIVGDHPAQ